VLGAITGCLPTRGGRPDCLRQTFQRQSKAGAVRALCIFVCCASVCIVSSKPKENSENKLSGWCIFKCTDKMQSDVCRHVYVRARVWA
jgi:hypothetical protein